MFFSQLHDKHFETDGKFLVELMNRLPHFITQSINRYDEFTRVNESIFFFPVLFSLFFVYYNVIQLRYFCWKYFLINLILLDGLLRLVCLLMVYSYFFMIIDQENVGTFLMTHILQQQFLYCFTWCTNQFLLLSIFSFSSDFFTYQLDFSLFWPCFDP